MAKLGRNDFMKKVSERIADETHRLEFMEDFADSFPEGGGGESPTVDYESDDNPYKGKYNDIYGRYMNRFYGGNDGKKTDKPDGDSSNKGGQQKVSLDDCFEKD